MTHLNPTHRGSHAEVARWAFYNIGAMMGPTDTHRPHGPLLPDYNPGCYLDGARGHYLVRDVTLLAVRNGFDIDPCARFALDLYDTHLHADNYPIGAIDFLHDEAIDYLNTSLPFPGHAWDYIDGDFGLYPNEDLI